MKKLILILNLIVIVICLAGIFTATIPLSIANTIQNNILSAQATTIKENITTRTSSLNDMSVDQIANMQKYDGRDYELVPEVKDQGDSDLCWAYSSNNAAEISILRSGITPTATKDNLSFSPTYLGNSVYNRGADPLKNTSGFTYSGNWQTSAGNFLYTADSFAQWCAPIPFNESANSNTWYEKSTYRLLDALEYNYSNGTPDTMTPIIKKAVAKYGAVAAGITYTGNRIEYYNPKYVSNGIGHAITIIGWDDTIDRNLFQPKAADRDGAWIIKNSYNSDPYFYVSYESTFRQFMALNFAPQEKYTYNYFYDSAGSKVDSSLNVGGNRPTNINKASNIFEAKGGKTGIAEYVQAVNVHLPQNNTTCKVQVYTNLKDNTKPTSGTLAAEATQTFEIGGYRTIELSTPVQVKRGSYFAIVVDVSATNNAKITFSNQKGKNSYSCDSYGSWSKISIGIPRIKAYTTTKEDSSVIAIDISDSQTTKITLPYASILYNGIPPEPVPTVLCNGMALTANQDFTLKYEYNNKPGDVNVYIQGINNYYGSQLMTFRIEKGNTPDISLNVINVQGRQTLSEFSNLLPKNWQWQNPSLILDGTVTTVIAEYNGSDKDYYKNTTHSITVNYVDSTPIPSPQPPQPEVPPIEEVKPQPPIPAVPPIGEVIPKPPVIVGPPNSDGDIAIQPPKPGIPSFGDGNTGNIGDIINNDGIANAPMETKDNSNWLWIILGISGGVVAVVAFIFVFILRKK